MDTNILLTEKTSKLFMQYSIPAIISMVINGMQSMIDGMFVGNILGSNGMASVTLASPFMQLIIGLSMIVSIGAQSYMGLKLGEGNKEKAENGFKTSVIFIVVVGFMITILGFVFSKNIALALGADEVLLGYVSTYIKMISIFAVPMALMFLFGFTGRILEKPELYFKGSILSLIVNIVLNYVLIAKLNLGIQGAAIATGMSYSAAFLVVVWPVLKKDSVVSLLKGKLDKETIMPILYNGSSEGVNSIATATAAFLFNLSFMKIAGADGVAAFTAINYIVNFGTLVMFGISDGIGPIVSYNYGNKRFDRVSEIMQLSSKTIIGIGTTIFIVLFFFGSKLITIFIQDNATVLNMAIVGSKIYAVAFFVNGFNIVNSGYFTFIGNAKYSVIVAASRGLVFIVVGIFILPMIFGTNGIWMTVPFAEIITFMIASVLMKKSNKKDKIQNLKVETSM